MTLPADWFDRITTRDYGGPWQPWVIEIDRQLGILSPWHMRTLNALSTYFDSWLEVAHATDAELRRCPNVGYKTVANIREVIEYDPDADNEGLNDNW